MPRAAKPYKCPPKTKKLLLDVKARILKEPEQFNMHSFFSDHSETELAKPPNCGTAACIAGWVLSVASKITPAKAWEKYFYSGNKIHPSVMAEDILKISGKQVSCLFYVGGWPEQFETPYITASTMPAKAKIAAKRIDYFIRCGE